MAKSEPFNMSAAIREALTANPKASSAEVVESISKANPKVKINKASFSVAFYTARRKMGGKKRGKKIGIRRGHVGRVNGHTVDLTTLQQAAKFLREVGGSEAALAAIKTVAAVQIGE